MPNVTMSTGIQVDYTINFGDIIIFLLTMLHTLLTVHHHYKHGFFSWTCSDCCSVTVHAEDCDSD
jgi:hypothetical protein